MVANGVGQFGQTVKRRAAARIPLDKGFERCSDVEMNKYIYIYTHIYRHMGMGQNLVPLVNIKIAGIYGCSSR